MQLVCIVMITNSKELLSLTSQAFTSLNRTETQSQINFYPFVLHEISVLIEFTLGPIYYLHQAPIKSYAHIKCTYYYLICELTDSVSYKSFNFKKKTL
jgi:hypothetical protein